MLEAARRELPSTLKTDAFSDEIEAVFTQARIAFARKYTVQEAQALAEKYAKTGADYNAKEIRGQFLKVLGLQPVLREPYLGAIQDLFVAENVDLITSIPDSNFDKIQNLVREAVNSGRLSRNLAADIESEYGAQISEVTNNVSARARLIARDQIAKLNSNLNMARMQSLGISKYTWRTSQDERVRQSHAELEGKEYFWNDPPSINGRRLHPGQP
jgi:SPP1 gp7 family putative phage head morphogenesis protein